MSSTAILTKQSILLLDNSSEITADKNARRSKQPLNYDSSTALVELFAENITAKIIRTAQRCLIGCDDESPNELNTDPNVPLKYPELVPQTGLDAGLYQLTESSYWTSGFFPGCLYLLLERFIGYPNLLESQVDRTLAPEKDLENGLSVFEIQRTLEKLGKAWSDPLVIQAKNFDTHDLGFMIMPHMRLRWELCCEHTALATIVQAAESLATRYNVVTGAIRSWNAVFWQKPPAVPITDMETNFLVIIDSMCNLELLFYAAAHSKRPHLHQIAEQHARTVIKTHLRPETAFNSTSSTAKWYSTYHVANLRQDTGEVQYHMTVQGHETKSTWSRGQAWAILGFSQAFLWTQNAEFLEAACGLAEFYLWKLENAPSFVEVASSVTNSNRRIGRYVPMWDLDAPPPENGGLPIRDTSAAMIAANGLLVLSQCLAAAHRHEAAIRFSNAALITAQDTIELSLAGDRTRLKYTAQGMTTAKTDPDAATFEAVLKNATVSNNAFNVKQIRDHGLVYADYFFIEFGNRLLRMTSEQ